MSCNIESTIELKKYLKKLLIVLERESTFNFIKTRLVNKNRVDDILCCVESSWPDSYKKFLNAPVAINLKSPKHYQRIMLAIKNRFAFSSSLYLVKYEDAVSAINLLIKSIDSDIKYISNQASGMF